MSERDLCEENPSMQEVLIEKEGQLCGLLPRLEPHIVTEIFSQVCLEIMVN